MLSPCNPSTGKSPAKGKSKLNKSGQPGHTTRPKDRKAQQTEAHYRAARKLQNLSASAGIDKQGPKSPNNIGSTSALFVTEGASKGLQSQTPKNGLKAAASKAYSAFHHLGSPSGRTGTQTATKKTTK